MDITSKLFDLYRRLNILAQTTKFPPARYQALKVIKENNPITLRKLAEIQNVSLPTMSKMVDDLQNQSLIIKAHNKDDARQRWIVPTQKGIQVLTQIAEENRLFWEKKLSRLSQQQKTQIVSSLDELNQILSSQYSE